MESKIKISKDGQEVICDVLFTFNDEQKGNDYIIYTDNSKDEDGNVKIYASRRNNNELEGIEESEERKLIEKVVNIVQETVMNNEN